MSGALKEFLGLLEERLVEHDECRKEVQAKLLEVCSKIREEADSLEEKISGKISEDFEKREERILDLIEKLDEKEGDKDALIKKAKEDLSREWKYDIQYLKKAKSFADSYVLKISSVKVESKIDFDSEDELESVRSQLNDCVDKLYESSTIAQERLTEICNVRKKEADDLGTRINGKLEDPFKAEDARIQSVVKMVKENICSEDPEKVKELIMKAKLALVISQSYSLIEEDSLDKYDLGVERETSLKWFDFEERKPTKLSPSFTKNGGTLISFSFFSGEEVKVLKGVDLPFEMEVELWEKGHKERFSKLFTKKLTLGSDEPVCFKSTFAASTTYCLKMRIVYQRMRTQWSDEAEFTTPEFKDLCVWKECPEDVDEDRKYTVSKKNPRIAMKIVGYRSIIIGSTSLPLNKVTSWSIKMLTAKRNGGSSIFIWCCVI